MGVNEIAPRVHNSGHHTLQSSTTSQFEQHLRAILGLDLGDTKILHPTIMCNILGPKSFSGPAPYEEIHPFLPHVLCSLLLMRCVMFHRLYVDEFAT